MKKFIVMMLIILPILSSCGDGEEDEDSDLPATEKPVIYLYPDASEEIFEEKPIINIYPENNMEISVILNYNGTLTTTYPKYNNGWKVTAKPDGILYDGDGNEYSYLFWEGSTNIEYDFSEGFVIKGNEAAEFFKEKLSYMGLIPREYNEFIVYWLPRLECMKYVLVSFQYDIYTDNAELIITPEPDSILRVFAAMKPLEEYIDVPEQELQSFKREGFTVIEWGGTILK